MERLDPWRFQPTVLLPAEGPLVGNLRALGCDVVILPALLKLTTRRGLLYWARYVLNYPRAVWKIARLIRRRGVDLVHTNTIHSLYGFAAAALTRRPHVWHVREIVFQSRLARALEVFLVKRGSARIVATSEAVAGMFGAGARMRPGHLRKIPNGIDTERFHPRNDGGRVRRELGIAPEAPVVGLVCRLDHWKGVEDFLRAAAACRPAWPRARFLVVGGAVEGREEYPARMHELARALGLEDSVRFTGWRYHPDDMPAVHAALDILVLASSRPEAFGLVLLEAMATCKPVVATGHGGPAEICVDGETAILVPPRDPGRMAEAIGALLADPGRALAMGQAGRRRVEALYDQRRCVERLQDLYDELLAG